MSEPALQSVPNYNNLEIVKTGTTVVDGDFSGAAGVHFVTVAHNLGYIPIPLVYTVVGEEYYPLNMAPGYGFGGGSIEFNNWATCSTDSSNLYIRFASGSATDWGEQSYKYYLLKYSAR